MSIGIMVLWNFWFKSVCVLDLDVKRISSYGSQFKKYISESVEDRLEWNTKLHCYIVNSSSSEL